jgi:hypothetical protein
MNSFVRIRGCEPYCQLARNCRLPGTGKAAEDYTGGRFVMADHRPAFRGPQWVDAVEKSFGGIYENFLKLLMRSMRGDVWDHIASQKNDHGLSYRRHEASQRRSSPKITVCEIFGVVRFSTFSTASVKTRKHSR